MKINQALAATLLRLALAAGFLSAVASRLGYWGSYSSGWSNFVSYTAQVNAFLPKDTASAMAVISTMLEISIGILLLLGYKTRLAALAAALLTCLFAIAMTISLGIKESLDYSAFAFSAGALLLSTMPCYKWSIDQLLNK